MQVRRRAKRHWRQVKRVAARPDRKQVLVFALVLAPVLLYLWFGSHWAFALFSTFVGVVLSTDFEVIRRVGFERAYQWIQKSDDLIDVVERNYYAKKYAVEVGEPIDLTYWNNSDFRATVGAEKTLKEGMRFLVYCEVPSPAEDDFEVPIPFCSAELGDVSRPNAGSVELSFTATHWFDGLRARDERDRRDYREYTEKLRSNDDTINPFVTVQETDELNDLTLEQWESFYECLENVEIHEGM